MKKHLKLLVLITILFIPFTVLAEENKFNVILKDEVINENDVNGSSIIAGNNVTSNNNVNGIDMLFGNNINYESNSEYALIAGNNVNVLGNIKNDAFIFGNLITFDQEFTANRDVFIFGNTVVLKGIINRDVTIYASSVVLEEVEILGNIKINATNLDIKSTSKVNGVLSYNEDIEYTIDQVAQISEIKTLQKIEQTTTIMKEVYMFFVDYCGIMVIFLALALGFPKLFRQIENNSNNVLSNLGYGALLLVMVPVICIILFSTGIGISLGILTILIYIILVWLSIIFTGYLIGDTIWKKIIKKESNILLKGLIGITVIKLLEMVPFGFGFIISFATIMIGLGTIIKIYKRD